MTRPLTEPSVGRSIAEQGWGLAQVARRATPAPGPWHYVGATDEPAFENSWVNSGGGLRQLRFRNSGMNSLDIEGVVTGGTPPSVVTTIPDEPLNPVMPQERFPLPDESQMIPGTGGHDWQLDPDGSLWVIT